MTEPMTDERLAAIEERAARVYPEEGGWNGTEAEDALPVVTEDVPALVAEVRRLRVLAAMHEHEAGVACRRLTEARAEYERTLRAYAEGPALADQLVAVSQSALDMERVADEAMTAGLAECDQLRAELDGIVARVAAELGCNGHVHDLDGLLNCALATRIERDEFFERSKTARAELVAARSRLTIDPHGVAVAERLAAPFAAESLGWDADGREAT